MQLNRNLPPGDQVDTGSLSNPPSSALGRGSGVGVPLGSEPIPVQESMPSYIHPKHVSVCSESTLGSGIHSRPRSSI